MQGKIIMIRNEKLCYSDWKIGRSSGVKGFFLHFIFFYVALVVLFPMYATFLFTPYTATGD